MQLEAAVASDRLTRHVQHGLSQTQVVNYRSVSVTVMLFGCCLQLLLLLAICNTTATDTVHTCNITMLVTAGKCKNLAEQKQCLTPEHTYQ